MKSLRAKIYHCPQCPAKYSCQFDIYEHLFEKHREYSNHIFRTRRIYECSICGLTTDFERKPKRLFINHVIKENHYDNFTET